MNNNDLESKVQNWILEEGMVKQKANDENSNFHYIIQYPENNIMDIIQPVGKDDTILVGCATQVAEEHIALMKNASTKDLESFLWDVKFNLNNFLVDFNLNINDDILVQFIVTDQIYEDGLNKNTLINLIKKVFRAKLQVVWLIEKYFGQITTNDVNDNVFSHNENSMFV